ncbi:universal stress protein [Catenulispora subtropica]
MSAPVVVAYDQTPHSKSAVAEAVREAVSRGTGLRIVHAYTTVERIPMGPFSTVLPAGNVEPTNRHDAEEILAELAAAIRADQPALAVETSAVPGEAAAAIVAQARDACLLVLGSRGRGGFTGLLLGSTSQRVLADAVCPVIVVHDTPSEPKGEILVGLDIDGPCDDLLEFAFDTAARLGTGLVAATVWTEPWAMAYAARLGDEDGLAYEQARADRLKELLDPWRGKHPDVGVVARLYAAVRSGTAGTCLVEASTNADLLIVGARSEAGHRHANRLGPVAHAALHHAHCPVAVVPSSDDR